MRVVCPVCKTQYNFSKLGMLKLIRRPACERCGANLLEKLREDSAPTPGKVVCARCAQQQEPAEYCKWCGAKLGQPKRAMALELPLPGRSEAPGKTSGLRRWVGFLPIILFIVFSAALSDLPREIYEAYKVVAPVIEENKRLKEALGGSIEIGPVPVFFRRETDASQGKVNATLYLWVKGPKDSTLVSAHLVRPASSPGKWKLTGESSFKGHEGKEIPLFEKEGPKPTKGSEKT